MSELSDELGLPDEELSDVVCADRLLHLAEEAEEVLALQTATGEQSPPPWIGDFEHGATVLRNLRKALRANLRDVRARRARLSEAAYAAAERMRDALVRAHDEGAPDIRYEFRDPYVRYLEYRDVEKLLREIVDLHGIPPTADDS